MRSVPRVPSILSIGSPRLDRVRVVDARSASPPPRWVNAGTATARARVAARARSTSARPTWPRRRSSAARAASSAAAAPRNCSAAPEPRGIASFGSGCVRRGGVTFVQNVLGGRVSQLRVGASRLPARLMSGGLRGFWPNAPPPLLAICFGTSVHERETGSRARAGDSAETREALRSSSWQAATSARREAASVRPPRTFRTSPPPARLAATIQSRHSEVAQPRRSARGRLRIADRE